MRIVRAGEEVVVGEAISLVEDDEGHRAAVSGDQLDAAAPVVDHRITILAERRHQVRELGFTLFGCNLHRDAEFCSDLDSTRAVGRVTEGRGPDGGCWGRATGPLESRQRLLDLEKFPIADRRMACDIVADTERYLLESRLL